MKFKIGEKKIAYDRPPMPVRAEGIEPPTHSV